MGEHVPVQGVDETRVVGHLVRGGNVSAGEGGVDEDRVHMGLGEIDPRREPCRAAAEDQGIAAGGDGLDAGRAAPSRGPAAEVVPAPERSRSVGCRR